MNSYSCFATSATPSTILYLVDISATMDKRLGGKRRIDVTFEALQAVLKTLVRRCTKGMDIQPRYRIGIYPYSDQVYDLLGGIKMINTIASTKIDPPTPLHGTRTDLAFSVAFQILQSQMPYLQDHPAPLVCHLTDDRYNGNDPTPYIQDIQKLRNKDGNVLIENIYISDRLSAPDANQWKGIKRSTQLIDSYANTLRDWSSDMPESYRDMMIEMGYPIDPGSVLLLPGTSPELVQLGFQITTMTGVAKRTVS